MISQKIQQIVAEAVRSAFGVEVSPELTRAEPQFGDFSTNVAFQLAGQLKKSPREVASELTAAIDDPMVDKAEAAGAGFVNLTLTDDVWLAELAKFGPDYAKGDVGRGRKLQVEFISANPTGPTTIGNARGGYIGDTLARVLAWSGFDVTREYYFNDAGVQIDKLLQSVKVSAGLVDMPPDEVQYRGPYIEELARDFKDQLQRGTEAEQKNVLTQAILERYIRPAIAKMNISFDVWFNEKDLISDGSLQRVLDELRGKGLVNEHDGAVWLDTGKLGVAREERVLIKSNGEPTYLAPDIAYHADIFGRRGFDVAVKVLGPDHLDQFPSLQAVIKELFPDKELYLASHQWFRLMKQGKEVKVSKRLGQYVTIEELIDHVGPDVARFMTLMRDEQSPMDFDLDLAAEESERNPYYYVMYSYARANSILEKALQRGLKPGGKLGQMTVLERHIVTQASRLPELIQEITRDFRVHRLVFFGHELAGLFHNYYEGSRIIDLPEEEVKQKLFFIQQYLQLMNVYFQVLGLQPQLHMTRQD